MSGIRSTYECQEKSLNIQAPKGPAIILVPISTHVTKLSHKASCLIPTISVPSYEPLSPRAMRKLTVNRNHREKSDSRGPETKSEPGAEKLPEGGAHPAEKQSSACSQQGKLVVVHAKTYHNAVATAKAPYATSIVRFMPRYFNTYEYCLWSAATILV